MNIAELFVRVRGDTTDVTKKLKGVEGSLAGVGRAAGGVPLPMNRMNTALRVMAQQATGTSGPVGSLLTSIAGFGMSGPHMAAALIGIAALAKAYELLTRKAREAQAEQTRLAASLGGFFPGTGTDSPKAQAFQAALKERARLTRELMVLEEKGQFYPGQIAALQEKILKLTTDINRAQMAGSGTLETVVIKTEKVAAGTQKAAKAAQELAFSWRDAFEFAHNLDNTIEKITLREAQSALGGPDLSTDIEGSVGMVKEEIKTREELTRASQDNAMVIRSAVLQSAQIIVSALNIGGGGKGSNLGGAIGSTAGFALGFTFGGGPVGGAIGSMIGQIGGSLLGGLFDSNKEALNRNTEATRANTMALLMNAPSGFKAAQGRFDATNVKDLRRAAERYSTRGGAPIFRPAT